MVIASCDGVKSKRKRLFMLQKLPFCVAFFLVTWPSFGFYKVLNMSLSSLEGNAYG
jgi:hypothetical protein